MLSNFFKITFRNLWKNKLFVAINIAGLGIALACCIVAYLNWQYNSEFDKNHANAGQIYRINFTRISSGQSIKNGISPAPLGQIITENFAAVKDVVRYYPTGGNFKVGQEIFTTRVTAVDPNFFNVFTFDMIHGAANQLKDKRSIYINENLAKRHFPDQNNPVGQTMMYINGDKRIDFRVAGVFAVPPLNSSFQRAESIVHYDNAFDIEELDTEDWKIFNTTFIWIESPGAVAGVEQQLGEYVAVQNNAKKDYKVDEYYLDPFVGMAVRSEREDVWNLETGDSLPIAAAIAPGIMALLLLLLACFNFANTSIAIANRRIKEIGIRKVLGSGKRQLIGQFLGENMILTFLALLFGIGLAVFLVPAYSAMWAFLEIELNFLNNPDLLIMLAALLLFTGIVAGSYPAFYISKFQPTTILRGAVKFSGTNTLTRVLLTLQFSISMITIISAIMFTLNANYQAEYDMGFDMDATLTAFVKNETGYIKLHNELEGYGSIASIAGSKHSLVRSWYTDPIKYDSEEIDVRIFDVGSDYLETVNAELKEGREFKENSKVDVDNSVIVNEELVNAYGWTDPINKRILLRDTLPLYVVGVVKNIHFSGGLWDPIRPMMLRYVLPDNYRFLTVATTFGQVSEVKRLMEDKWKTVFPDELPTIRTMDEQRAQMTEVNANIRTMFLFLGMVAIVLSIIGLFSLVSLNLNKRMKEIGVRKVLGASLANISVRMSMEFLIILFLASIIGVTAGYFLADMLMSSIWAYYVGASAWIFVSSIMILLLIGLLTILSKVVQAATVNPALILRDE
jgi:putative ABC transport system permease protein